MSSYCPQLALAGIAHQPLMAAHLADSTPGQLRSTWVAGSCVAGQLHTLQEPLEGFMLGRTPCRHHQPFVAPLVGTPLPVLHAAGLAPYYEHLCTELGWTPDQTKLTEMQGANLKQLEELDAKIKASLGKRSCPSGRLGASAGKCSCRSCRQAGCRCCSVPHAHRQQAVSGTAGAALALFRSSLLNQPRPLLGPLSTTGC